MNAALDNGADALRAQGFTTVLACVGDLPALRAESIIKVLAAARSSGADRAFLADASGVGTTMLIAHDTRLLPHFQGRSAAAHHASGAINLAEHLAGSRARRAARRGHRGRVAGRPGAGAGPGHECACRS